MCGISGILGCKSSPEDVQRVRAMVRAQAHRGPDSWRVAGFPGAVLGHNRLSIIDLSIRAAQPMSSPDGRHVLVYNGEIYNYLELRRELESLPGADPWSSDSDSEVLLAGLRRWGPPFLEKLNGMFAFCFYDTATGEAFLARDRFGQKPLVLAQDETSLLFASEIKALLAAGVPAAPDRDAWGAYLSAATYDDTPNTMFAGIIQLRPGESATFRPGRGLTRQTWYRLLDRVVPRSMRARDAAAELKTLITDACRIHMRADVPVGVSLSGGVDSSALLAGLELAGELHENVRCYSVDFGADYSERPWIQAAAGHHGLTADIREYFPDLFRSSLSSMVWQMEGPVGGLMNSALAQVMSAARENGVKVLQDGTGIDEAFAGYRNIHDLYVGRLLAAGDPDSRRVLAEYAGNWSETEESARSVVQTALSKPITAIDGTVPVRPDLLNPDWRSPPPAKAAPPSGDGFLRHWLAELLQGSKIPRNMRMKDRLGMAFGLELRLPFLDHRLVEFGLSLSPDLWFLGGRSKAILREALAGAMDDDVRLAPKRSVHTPQERWLRSEPMASYIRALLASESFASRGFFDVAASRSAFERFIIEGAPNSFFVWQWINLEEWFRVFIDRDALVTPRPLCPDLYFSEKIPND
jgi:asparagine synthase (glutamine-hydrolysing)